MPSLRLPAALPGARSVISAGVRPGIAATPGVIASMTGSDLRRAAEAATPRTIATPAASLLQVVYAYAPIDGGATSAAVQVNFSNRGTVIGMYGIALPADPNMSLDFAQAVTEAKIEIQGASYLTTNGETADFVPFAATFPSGAGYLSLAWPVNSGDRWLVTFRNLAPSSSSSGSNTYILPKLVFTFALQ